MADDYSERHEPPVDDESDMVSAFMGLHLAVKSAASRVVYAAGDVPRDDAIKLEAILKTMVKDERLFTREQAHYIEMCASMLTGWNIARLAG